MDKQLQKIGAYWDSISDIYMDAVSITTNDFHYGPLVYGDSKLRLLPSDLVGISCLEIGAGAGQNSIYLAKQGASCLATDISNKQIMHGSELAKAEKVDVEFKCVAMEDINLESYGMFDFIHSSYAITFTEDPSEVVANLSRMLKPGGVFLLSTGHPLFTGEWLEIDGDNGLFLTNYFEPVPDIRYDENDNERIRSNFYSINDMSNWFYNAGLMIERVLEPEPININEIPEAERREKIPYYSNGWAEYYEQLKFVPAIIVFKCRKLGVL